MDAEAPQNKQEEPQTVRSTPPPSEGKGLRGCAHLGMKPLLLSPARARHPCSRDDADEKPLPGLRWDPGPGRVVGGTSLTGQDKRSESAFASQGGVTGFHS